MATRYIGRAKLNVTWDDRAGQYKVSISVNGKHRSTQYVGAPRYSTVSVDSPEAHDQTAGAAASFETDDRGAAADALASGYNRAGTGWDVRRTGRKNPASRAASRARKPARKTRRATRR
jgi:hypothetical protein